MAQESPTRTDDPRTQADDGHADPPRGPDSDRGIPIPPALGSGATRGDDSGGSGSSGEPKGDKSIAAS